MSCLSCLTRLFDIRSNPECAPQDDDIARIVFCVREAALGKRAGGGQGRFDYRAGKKKA